MLTAREMAARLGPPSALILDCDGVILDSNALKTLAFRRAFLEAGYPLNVVDRFTEIQMRSFGMSRYQLIRMFFTELLNQVVDERAERYVMSRFAEQCRQGYLEVEITPGADDLFSNLAKQMPLYVASGSDEDELRDVLRRRELGYYFRTIYGSPRKKSDSIALILDDLRGCGINPEGTWMIGDAKPDYEAATVNGILFVFMAGYSTV
jgi:phosphoglycolate phosphatase-like HAD superfamily hydrolase